MREARVRLVEAVGAEGEVPAVGRELGAGLEQAVPQGRPERAARAARAAWAARAARAQAG